MSKDKEPELSPEEEALVGQFVGQLNAGTESEPMLATPVGLVPITPEQNKKIQDAAVQRIISKINTEPPSLAAKIVRDISGICFAALVLAGTAYVVHAAVRAIFG